MNPFAQARRRPVAVTSCCLNAHWRAPNRSHSSRLTVDEAVVSPAVLAAHKRVFALFGASADQDLQPGFQHERECQWFGTLGSLKPPSICSC